MRRFALPLAARRSRWFVVFVVASVIFVASVVAVPGAVSSSTPWWDEFTHLVAYAVFASALAYATAHWRVSTARRVAVVVGVAVGFGVLVELTQTFLPYRQFSRIDLVVNVVGASLVVFWFAVERRIRYELR